MAQQNSTNNLKLISFVSFNLHGFNQGFATVNDLIDSVDPDLFLVQEHWLTPANLSRFDIFTNYFTFGCSAMNEVIESGMLKGRPFGGAMIMIKKELRQLTETVFCSNRYAIVRVANLLFINVYLPCSGTLNRLTICQDLLVEIWSWCEQFSHCQCIFAGDFNVNLDNSDPVSDLLNSMLSEHSLLRRDVLFSKTNIPTYVNTALNHQSTIDYVITSCKDIIDDFVILDPDINFSDHLPIMAKCRYIDHESAAVMSKINNSDNSHSALPVQFRWDHADLIGYYRYTPACGYNLC